MSVERSAERARLLTSRNGRPRKPASMTRDEVIEEAKRIARELNAPYMTSTYLMRGGLTHCKVMRHFNRWTELYAAAGLTRYPHNAPVSDEEIFRGLHKAFLELGGIPTQNLAAKRYGHSLPLFQQRFGRWRDVLTAFRAWCEAEAPEFPYLDELPRREADAAYRVPATARKIDRSCVAPAANSDARPLGALINFRQLLHAPVNESGVILLFGMIAGDIGFAIETVQSGFPDCEAKRQVGAERWQRVRIEFEFMSRNFLRHGHDPKGCDLIVCWEHNWPECPLEVMELKSAIRRLSWGRDEAAPRVGHLG